LEHIVEQRDFEPAGAVVEREDRARPALLHFVDLAGDGHGLAAAEAAIALAHAASTGQGPFARQVAEPVRNETRDAGLERIHRMAREIEAKCLALALAAH